MGNLDWPAGWERTPAGDRERNARFEATLGATTSDLATELDRMNVDDWRASIGNQHTKSNGLPLSNANPDDPGFVLRWSDGNEQYAVACDAYSRLRDNVRAAYLWLHETRMRSQRPVRTGDSEFAAARLPPGAEGDESAHAAAGSVTRADPHEVLNVAPDAPESVVTAAARSLKAEHHPDSGGDREAFQRVVDAESAMLGGDE